MTWTALNYAFGSKLTSTKMTQNQDNFAAMAHNDSGAPALGMYLLNKSQSPSGAATVDITGLDTSFYIHEFHLINIIPSTSGGHLRMLLSTDNGSSWASSNYYTDLQGNLGYSSGSAAQFHLNSPTTGDGISTGSAWYSYGAIIRAINLGGSVYGKRFSIQGSYARESDGGKIIVDGGMVYESASAINAVRFIFSAGNISGEVRVLAYGKTYA